MRRADRLLRAGLALLLCVIASPWPLANAGEEGRDYLRAAVGMAGVSDDPTYGYSPDNPIRMGGMDTRDVGARLWAYSASLTGFDGHALRWERVASCCPFPLPNGASDARGFLDRYRLIPHRGRPFILFVDHYRQAPLYAPIGFTHFAPADLDPEFRQGMEAFAKGDMAAAKRDLLLVAEKGSLKAQKTLAAILASENNAAESLRWSLSAAEKGDPFAQRTVGIAYLRGDGVEKDSEQGYAWIRKAAYFRDPVARVILARQLMRGSDLPRDPEKAILWLRLAAEQGEVAAQLDYAAALLKGEGVPKSPKVALVWLAIAKAVGNEQAEKTFASLTASMEPQEVKQIESLAKAWSEQEQPSELPFWTARKADGGDPVAQLQYGRILANGILVPKDMKGALFFFKLSANGGNEEADALYARFAKEASPALLKEVDAAVAAWTRDHQKKTPNE